MPLSSVIASQGSRAYPADMAAALFRLLALFALVLMPAGMAASPAAAHRTQAAAAAGHCGEQNPGAPVAPSADCTVTCAALPAAEMPKPATRILPRPPRTIAFVAPITGIVPEIATPPPKRT